MKPDDKDNDWLDKWTVPWSALPETYRRSRPASQLPRGGPSEAARLDAENVVRLDEYRRSRRSRI